MTLSLHAHTGTSISLYIPVGCGDEGSVVTLGGLVGLVAAVDGLVGGGRVCGTEGGGQKYCHIKHYQRVMSHIPVPLLGSVGNGGGGLVGG